MDPKAAALALYCGYDYADVTWNRSNTYSVGRAEYQVLTDAEADEAAKNSILETLEEYLACLPKLLRYYFDEDLYVNDCLGADGRGAFLDAAGEEKYQSIFGHDEELQAWIDEEDDGTELDELQEEAGYYIYQVD